LHATFDCGNAYPPPELTDKEEVTDGKHSVQRRFDRLSVFDKATQTWKPRIQLTLALPNSQSFQTKEEAAEAGLTVGKTAIDYFSARMREPSVKMSRVWALVLMVLNNTWLRETTVKAPAGCNSRRQSACPIR
jgi:hypothetical protein